MGKGRDESDDDGYTKNKVSADRNERLRSKKETLIDHRSTRADRDGVERSKPYDRDGDRDCDGDIRVHRDSSRSEKGDLDGRDDRRGRDGWDQRDSRRDSDDDRDGRRNREHRDRRDRDFDGEVRDDRDGKRGEKMDSRVSLDGSDRRHGDYRDRRDRHANSNEDGAGEKIQDDRDRTRDKKLKSKISLDSRDDKRHRGHRNRSDDNSDEGICVDRDQGGSEKKYSRDPLDSADDKRNLESSDDISEGEFRDDGGKERGKKMDSRVSLDGMDDKRHRDNHHRRDLHQDSNEDKKLLEKERRIRLGDRHSRDRNGKRSNEDVREREHRKPIERERERERESERRSDGGRWDHHRRENDGVQRQEDKDNILENSGTQRATLQDRNNTNTDANTGRSGGVYIPPFKLARMMKEVQDKSSIEYQRLTWDALRKSINGLVNKVNATNIKNIIPELFAENIIRGRGLFCRSCMKSQMASPGFTDVFAALVAVVNTKFPEVGNLLLRRIVLQLKRAYKRNDKPQLLAATKFIAHLVNQQIAHEIIALELLTVLLENPTDDSVEVAVGFVTECGSLLQDLSPQGLHGIFERFRGILHEGEIDKRVQFLIEGLFAIRKAKFQGYPAVRPELDLVEQEDQCTHDLSLEDEIDQEIGLDIFKPDPQFLEHEKDYENLKRDILGDESSEDEAGSGEASDDEEDEESDEEDEDEEAMKIKDETETNLVNLRRTIYLTIMSSVDFEEAGHKLLKIKLEPGQEMELCIMLLECCSQERTYLRYYGLLGQRFCMINKVHQENFEKCFVQQYSMIHRLETNKLRNVAKFFAHLLGTDALPWHVLAYIRLTEEDTTSSSRIFIKILFQELSEHLGIRLLNERLIDPTMQDTFESIFPKDNPKNTRFSINFFTSIGLGGITESLREYLKNMPRLIMQQQKPVSGSEDESGSSSASDSDSSSSESESEASSDESDRDQRRRKRRKRD
eukprot:TRINITY_DN3655_c0_g1_i5.p1 TRINITY_DN3655_c0_g1~~TRINITY_DN3655_c0_g1_i5.p1  ORF type:complete len:967 (-),score=214.30 TRINITY_DN3655_c0_g1_i5:96-2996(-)